MKIPIGKIIGIYFLFVMKTSIFALPDGNIGAQDPTQIPVNFDIQKDLVYKTIDGQKLTYDFISSKTVSDPAAPLLIYIHGGGWRGGVKEAFYSHLFFDSARPLVERGMKVATINYRLAKKKARTTTVTSVTDCKDAVRFFAANAKRLEVDPKRFIVIGSSAGGHLTLMTALAPDEDYPTSDPALSQNLPPLLAAVPVYPLCHFGQPAIMKGSSYGAVGRFTNMLGGPIEENEELARQLSPIHFLQKDSLPIFILHGDADTVLPILSPHLFVEKARKIGAKVKYLEVKDGNHGFSKAGDPDIEGIIQQITTYLADHLWAKPPRVE